jgi:pyruvate/2-oxoglutarate dehydrogenase complex dihydrolipoamide acyltransferase (E2) component
MNSSLDVDAQNCAEAVHPPVAVDTDRGLVVPKIENADEEHHRDPVELERDRGRRGENRLTLEEDDGSTLTVTNLGSLGRLLRPDHQLAGGRRAGLGRGNHCRLGRQRELHAAPDR